MLQWSGIAGAFYPQAGVGRMKPSIYLDARIPSFCYEDRPGAVMQAWREITVAWYWKKVIVKIRWPILLAAEFLRIRLRAIGEHFTKRSSKLGRRAVGLQTTRATAGNGDESTFQGPTR